MCQKVHKQVTTRHPYIFNEVHDCLKRCSSGCLYTRFHPCFFVNVLFGSSIPTFFTCLPYFCTISNHVSEMHTYYTCRSFIILHVAYTVALLHLRYWRPISVEYSTPCTRHWARSAIIDGQWLLEPSAMSCYSVIVLHQSSYGPSSDSARVGQQLTCGQRCC